MYTANITVGEPVLQDGTTLAEAGTYNMQGTYTQGIATRAIRWDKTVTYDAGGNGTEQSQ